MYKLKGFWIPIALTLLLVAGFFSRPWIATWIAQENRKSLTEESAQEVLDRLAKWEKTVGSNADTELTRAEAYRKLGDAIRLKKHVERAISMGMKKDLASQPLWLQMAASGLLDEPQKHVAQLLKSYHGKESEVYEAFLKGYTASWRLGDANKMIKQWRELYPEEARTYYWEGALHALDYRVASATTLFEKAIAMDPSLWEARLRLAELLVEQSKLPEAEEHFELLYKEFPQMRSVAIGYARCLMNEGFSENALKLLESIDEKVIDSPLLFLKCQAAFEANNNEQAEKWLEELCRRWPEVAPYRDLQGRVKEILQKREEATAVFKIASESQLKQQAMNHLITSLDEDPGNIQVRIQLGKSMMYYLSPEAGSSQVSSAIALEPSSLEAHQLLVDYYRREGQSDLMRRHQSIVDRLSPASSAGDKK